MSGPGRGAGASRPDTGRINAAQRRRKDKARRSGRKNALKPAPETAPEINERPAPWARTGQGSRSGPRPAAGGGRGNFPNRPGAGSSSSARIYAAVCRGSTSGQDHAQRTTGCSRRSAAGEQTKRAARGAKTPPNWPKIQPEPARPAPWARTGPSSRSAPRPASAAGRGNFPQRPGGGPARPPGSPPPAGGQRPPKARWVPGGARPSASFRPKEGRSPNPGAGPKRPYDRPRAGGEQKSAVNPAFSRDDRKPRPPFAPGSRPPGSWPRASSGKPGGKRGKPPGKKPRA